MKIEFIYYLYIFYLFLGFRLYDSENIDVKWMGMIMLGLSLPIFFIIVGLWQIVVAIPIIALVGYVGFSIVNKVAEMIERKASTKGRG